MDLATIGNLLLALASACAVASIVAFATAGRGGENARKLGHILTFGVLGAITLAILLLTVAFLSENWSLQYVVFNHPPIPGPWAWVYRISGVWAGREGSLLFWEWVLSIYAGFIALKFFKKDSSLGAVGLGIVNFVQLFFLAALFIRQNNPFILTPSQYVDQATGALDRKSTRLNS